MGAVGASAFVRPRFFGGMLLTEDDLQAIDEYTLAKRRLTNRHMFGPGVVCGLEVDCDPCKPGWLTVSPGYALDCCGNDIVVGCPEKLDALALLSELRRRCGADCGDPCDKQPRTNYLLVVTYDEQLSDAVAPYAQDDCAVGDCDFSRVRESYRFELVCDAPETDPDLFGRLEECAKPSDKQTKSDIDTLTRIARLAKTQAQAAAAEESGVAPDVEVPTDEEFDTVAPEGIAAEVSLLGRSILLLAAAAAHDAQLGPATQLSEEQRIMISARSRSLAEAVLGSEELNALPEAELRRITAVAQAARDQQGLEQLTIAQRIWVSVGLEPADASNAFAADAERVRSRILSMLEKSGQGNCGERREVERLSVHRLDANSLGVVQKLAQLFLSAISDCLCDAANPPCPNCTDLRVPLAEITIDGCEVVDVCGLARQWVLAPRTLNYWVPIVEMLRPILMERCCTHGYDQRPIGKGSAKKPEIAVISHEVTRAATLLRDPAEAPEFRELFMVLNEPLGTPTETAEATSASAASPPPAMGLDPAEMSRLHSMEQELNELREVVRKLTGGGES
jgi:hypothetical protein